MTDSSWNNELFGRYQNYLTNFPIKMLLLEFFCGKLVAKIRVLDPLEASDDFSYVMKVVSSAILYINRP